MSDTDPNLSIIIPARNEAFQIEATVQAVLDSVARLESVPVSRLHLSRAQAELLVVDNLSRDGTGDLVRRYRQNHGVRCLSCPRLKAPCARNHGADHSRGRVLIFVDADTWIPEDALIRIRQLVKRGYGAGIFAYAAQEEGFRPWCWWAFWNQVRRLPLARAKAMPAFMYCTREVFDRFGPFDERVVIGEEWPILAGLYCHNRCGLIYDRTLRARSSSRRMQLQPFGYVRNLFKYTWAILHFSGRVAYADTIRQVEILGTGKGPEHELSGQPELCRGAGHEPLAVRRGPVSGARGGGGVHLRGGGSQPLG